MNPLLLQIIVGLVLLLLLMFLMSYTLTILENTVKRIVSHYYSERLNYHRSLAEPPAQEPIPFHREVK